MCACCGQARMGCASGYPLQSVLASCFLAHACVCVCLRAAGCDLTHSIDVLCCIVWETRDHAKHSSSLKLNSTVHTHTVPESGGGRPAARVVAGPAPGTGGLPRVARLARPGPRLSWRGWWLVAGGLVAGGLGSGVWRKAESGNGGGSGKIVKFSNFVNGRESEIRDEAHRRTGA